MAKKLYEESGIQAIADAIREKNGLPASYKVSEMAAAILALSESGGSSGDNGGVIFPPTGSWTFSKVFEAASEYSIGSCEFSGDTFVGKCNAANTGAGIHSNGKINLTGLNTLRVEFSAKGIVSGQSQFSLYVQNEIGSSSVAGDVVDRVATANEISAGAMDVDVSAVNGSYYIILGVGTWSGQRPEINITKISLDGDGSEGSGTDTSDATATENHILYPETAYVGGVKVKGAIQSIAAQTYTPGAENQVIAAGQYLSGAQTIQGDPNLVPGNIKSGVSIFGIVGSYAGSAASGGSAQSATGTMAGSGSNDMSFSVDFEPDLVRVCVSDLTAMQANAHIAGAIIVRDLFAQCAYRRASTTAFSNGNFGYDVTGLVRSTALQASYSGGVCTVHAVQGSYKFISDCEYTWTAIKF